MRGGGGGGEKAKIKEPQKLWGVKKWGGNKAKDGDKAKTWILEMKFI